MQQIEHMMVLLIEKQVGGATGSADFLRNGTNRIGHERTGQDRTNTQSDELMTIREAYLELNVSRSTIDKLRKQGDLTSYYHNNHVRLLRSEVMAAKRWYSNMKGKL